jgi:hypothetical protein
MTKSGLLAVLAIALLLSACGRNDTKEINCVANLEYQNRVEGERVIAPEGLDQLNVLAEMPIPRADPNAPKMPEGMCNDAPPIIGPGK